MSARRPAVAGAFYPANAERLRGMVTRQLTEAGQWPPVPGTLRRPLGLLVPHAGLEYSGVVAAAAWRLLAADGPDAPRMTVVILGTNHRAAWLDGIGVWDHGAWAGPLGEVAVDDDLAAAIVGLGPPFVVDRDAHRDEHSIEVQLPFLQAVVPRARIVPLAVSAGTGRAAIEAGVRLGRLVARHREAGTAIVLAISSDMAHYPTSGDAERVTVALLAPILGLDAAGLAADEAALRMQAARGQGLAGLACGMCGIEPTVTGLEALRASGARSGTALAQATSADAGGPRDRTVGYLAVRFD